MNSIHTRSVASSEISDLDGFTVSGDYGYSMQNHYDPGTEDFGFDPPQNPVYLKSEPFSPSSLPDPLQLSGWSGFDTSEHKQAAAMNHLPSPTSKPLTSFEMERILGQTLPNSTTLSRFGQVTPPRSNSASPDDDSKSVDIDSSKPSTADRRKRNSKVPVKEEMDASQTSTTGRKRKNTRKSNAAKEEQDDKRRQSLEKNRLAAAKCRINKKEKTEQLQRNSHEKAVHNAFLKEQVMRMKEEVQQMNAILLSHANCEGCKSPEEIQKHLSNLGNEFYAQHMRPLNYDYNQVNLDDMSGLEQDSSMHSDYFAHSNASTSMLNSTLPDLPEFNRAAEFEVQSPMHTD